MDYSAFDNFWDGVIVVNQKLNLLYANDAAANILNLSQKRIQTLYQKPVNQILKFKDNRLLEPSHKYSYAKVRVDGGKFKSVMVFVNKDSEIDSNLHIYIKDVSVEENLQKKYLRELKMKERHIEELKEADKIKDRFMLLATHELRTPLSALVGSCDILVNEDLDQASQKIFIQTIYDQSNHIMGLVNNILDYTRVASDKIEYYVELLPVRDILLDTLKSLRDFATECQVHIDIPSPEAMAVEGYFDSHWLGVVIRNILHNAIKFNRPSGRVDIQVLESQDGDLLRIEIEDSGCGISPNDFDKIFSRFNSVNELNHHQSGTGFSLALGRKIVESLGGTIELESTVGKGSKFTVCIPKSKVLNSAWYRKPTDSNTGNLAA